MIIDGVKMQYQSMDDCAYDIMCSPPWQRYTIGKNKGMIDPDYIIEFFCRNTAEANIRNLYFKEDFMTLKNLNEKIIEFNGYYYLYWLNKNKGNIENTYNDMKKNGLIGKESYVIPSVVNWILGIKKEIPNWKGAIDVKSKNEFFMIKTPFNTTGHYSMIYKNNLDYIDSFDGEKKTPEKILDIIKIIF